MREVVLVDGQALGERADAAVTRPAVHLVADREAGHLRPDPGHHPGEVVPLPALAKLESWLGLSAAGEPSCE